MMDTDVYRTIKSPSTEVLYKDRGSKFFGYAYPIRTEEEASDHIQTLKKLHPSARHWCYAWQLGTGYESYRANDDGEPGNSAGMPIYGAIQSMELTNVLVVVVRYFGGTKLGVGGLIQAYRSSAKMALEQSAVVERTIDMDLTLEFDYSEMNKVMRIIKEEQLKITSQKMEMRCQIRLSIRKGEFPRVLNRFKNLHKIQLIKPT